MSNLNIDKFIADDDAGDDLEYTPDFRKLETQLQGKPEQVNDQKEVISSAEPPAWRLAYKSAEKLLLESKDLRIATGLVRCLIAIHGVYGLATGFKLIEALLEKYWESIHPLPDEPGDFMSRVNSLAALNDRFQTLDYLRGCPLLKNKNGLTLNLRAFYIAAGKLQAKTDELKLTSNQLQMAVNDADASDAEAVLEAIRSALVSINRVMDIFREKSSQDEPNFKNIIDDLNLILPYFNKALQPTLVEPTAPSEIQTSPLANTVQSPQVAVKPQSIQSRADVVEILEKVCLFLEETEPAHPAPLFIRRGQRLLGMDFMEIIKELSPDAYDTISHLSGKKTSEDD